MNASFAQRLSGARSRFDTSLFMPLALVLTLIAVLHALQTFSATHHATLGALPAILVSKLMYYWYFVLLAFVIQRHSRRVVFTRRTAFAWSAVHTATLVCSFLIHESLSVAIEGFVRGMPPPSSLVVLLFNNPAVWMEIFVYVIFLLVFSLLEFQRINRENELRCMQLEARLTKTKLQELRNNIQPAFLVTTLLSILSLVRERRNHDANHVLSLLSDFLRATVYDNDRDESTIEGEMHRLTTFIETEIVRIRVTGHDSPGMSDAPPHGGLPQ